MQDFIGSFCRSLVFKPYKDDGSSFGGFVDKIGSSNRKSRIGLFAKLMVPALPPPVAKSGFGTTKRDDAPAIWWRKGELIGSGAFGRVYMGMNLDSVSIAVNTASKEKTQDHIRELEEELSEATKESLTSKHCRIFGNCKRGGIIEYFVGVCSERINIVTPWEIWVFPRACFENVQKIVVAGLGIPSQKWYHAQRYQGNAVMSSFMGCLNAPMTLKHS